MKLKLRKIGIAIGTLLGTTFIAYAITSLFFSDSETSNLSKKTLFQFELSTDMVATEVGPGDSFDVKPLVYNDATEEMYVFIQVDLPTNQGNAIYSYNVSNDWCVVHENNGSKIYAYADSVMTVLYQGESTSSLTEQMTMNSMNNAEYADIDDINITITGYAIGTEGISTNPVDAWNQCKIIGNIE